MIFPNCLNVETFLTHQWSTQQFQIQIVRHIYIYMTSKKLAEAVDIDCYEIDFEDEYDKADSVDDVDLNESIANLNKSI